MHVEQRILHQRHIPEAATLATQVANLPTETGPGEVSNPPYHRKNTPISVGPDGLTPMIQIYPFWQETEKT